MVDFSEDERKSLAKKGLAMPDGGYPIRNRKDLENAIKAYGRGNNKEQVKRWIKKRAKELKAEDMLPANWENTKMEHSDHYELFHYGVKGMKWGVRRAEKRKAKAVDQSGRAAQSVVLGKQWTYQNLQNMKKKTDADWEKEFDDKEYLKSVGGPSAVRKLEIDRAKKLHEDQIKAADNWIKIHEEVMNTPVEEFGKNKHLYQNIIDKYQEYL